MDKSGRDGTKNALFRQIPRIDKIMETKEAKELTEKYGYAMVKEAARNAEELLRMKLKGKMNPKADQKTEQQRNGKTDLVLEQPD